MARTNSTIGTTLGGILFILFLVTSGTFIYSNSMIANDIEPDSELNDSFANIEAKMVSKISELEDTDKDAKPSVVDRIEGFISGTWSTIKVTSGSAGILLDINNVAKQKIGGDGRVPNYVFQYLALFITIAILLIVVSALRGWELWRK